MARSKPESSSSRGNIDMLSSLPDPVLHHIMSFMPARKAVQLCVLSKRWKTLWTTLPILNFGFYELGNNQLNHSALDRVEMLVEVVSMVLLLREATSQLHTFALNCVPELPDYVGPRDVLRTSIRPWIQCAIKCNLRVLTVSIWDKAILLPSEIFTCSSLEYVTLNSPGRINTPEIINLPSLKRLQLQYAEFDQDFMSKLLCGCPVLEDLHVEGGLVEFCNITSHSLKHLKIMQDCPSESIQLREMIINSPNLLSFHFQICCCQEKGIMLNMPSLLEAFIEFYLCTAKYKYGKINVSKSNILRGLVNVHRLELGGDRDDYSPKVSTFISNFKISN